MMEGKFDSMGNSMKAKRIKEMQKDVGIFAFRPPGYDCQTNKPNISMYH